MVSSVQNEDTNLLIKKFSQLELQELEEITRSTRSSAPKFNPKKTTPIQPQSDARLTNPWKAYQSKVGKPFQQPIEAECSEKDQNTLKIKQLRGLNKRLSQSHAGLASFAESILSAIQQEVKLSGPSSILSLLSIKHFRLKVLIEEQKSLLKTQKKVSESLTNKQLYSLYFNSFARYAFPHEQPQYANIRKKAFAKIETLQRLRNSNAFRQQFSRKYCKQKLIKLVVGHIIADKNGGVNAVQNVYMCPAEINGSILNNEDCINAALVGSERARAALKSSAFFCDNNRWRKQHRSVLKRARDGNYKLRPQTVTETRGLCEQVEGICSRWVSRKGMPVCATLCGVVANETRKIRKRVFLARLMTEGVLKLKRLGITTLEQGGVQLGKSRRVDDNLVWKRFFKEISGIKSNQGSIQSFEGKA